MGLIIASVFAVIVGATNVGYDDAVWVNNHLEKRFCTQEMTVKECNERKLNKGPSNIEKIELARRGQHETAY